MALIRMCVVPNFSQQLSQPILWIVTVCTTYWTHIVVCVFNEKLNLNLTDSGNAIIELLVVVAAWACKK